MARRKTYRSDQHREEHQKVGGNRPAPRTASAAQSQMPSVPRSVTRSSLTHTELELPHGFWRSPSRISTYIRWGRGNRETGRSRECGCSQVAPVCKRQRCYRGMEFLRGAGVTATARETDWQGQTTPGMPPTADPGATPASCPRRSGRVEALSEVRRRNRPHAWRAAASQVAAVLPARQRQLNWLRRARRPPAKAAMTTVKPPEASV